MDPHFRTGFNFDEPLNFELPFGLLPNTQEQEQEQQQRQNGMNTINEEDKISLYGDEITIKSNTSSLETTSDIDDRFIISMENTTEIMEEIAKERNYENNEKGKKMMKREKEEEEEEEQQQQQQEEKKKKRTSIKTTTTKKKRKKRESLKQQKKNQIHQDWKSSSSTTTTTTTTTRITNNNQQQHNQHNQKGGRGGGGGGGSILREVLNNIELHPIIPYQGLLTTMTVSEEENLFFTQQQQQQQGQKNMMIPTKNQEEEEEDMQMKDIDEDELLYTLHQTQMNDEEEEKEVLKRKRDVFEKEHQHAIYKNKQEEEEEESLKRKKTENFLKIIEGYATTPEEKILGGKSNKYPMRTHVIRVDLNEIKKKHEDLEKHHHQFKMKGSLHGYHKFTKSCIELSCLQEIQFDDHTHAQFNGSQEYNVCFDRLIVKHSSHNHGQRLFIRFSLMDHNNTLMESIDTVEFETITRRGIEKQRQKERVTTANQIVDNTPRAVGVYPTVAFSQTPQLVKIYGHNLRAMSCQQVTVLFGTQKALDIYAVAEDYIICETPVVVRPQSAEISIQLTPGTRFIPTGITFTFVAFEHESAKKQFIHEFAKLPKSLRFRGTKLYQRVTSPQYMNEEGILSGGGRDSPKK